MYIKILELKIYDRVKNKNLYYYLRKIIFKFFNRKLKKN